MAFDLRFVPYVLLLLAITFALGRRRVYSLIVFALAIAAALYGGHLAPSGLASLLVMGTLSYLARDGRSVTAALAWTWAILLTNDLLPGFRNVAVFDHVRFTADARPFTMYLSFEKTAAGLWLYLFVVPRVARRLDWRVVARGWLAVTATLMTVALATGYVRFDPKWPLGAGWWALNNFFFVCLSEETVFRGVLQARLAAWWGRAPAIVVAALAFGLQHHRGGPAYVALAGVAGLFYGFAFARARRVEASMLVHFGLNLTHLALFTYPSLTR